MMKKFTQFFLSNQNKKRNASFLNQDSGFTLIEMVFYLAIAVVILLTSTLFVWDVIDNKTKATAYQEVLQNGRFALDKITKEIQSATEITSFPDDSLAQGWLPGYAYRQEIRITTSTGAGINYAVVINKPAYCTEYKYNFVNEVNLGGSTPYSSVPRCYCDLDSPPGCDINDYQSWSTDCPRPSWTTKCDLGDTCYNWWHSPWANGYWEAEYEFSSIVQTPCGSSINFNGHSYNYPHDIRFTGSDGTTELDYWEQTKCAENGGCVPGDPLIFWVEIKDNLSTSDKHIYIYYGNAEAQSASNGKNTFIAFDDFSGSELSDDWEITVGSPIIQNSELTMQQATYAYIENTTFVRNRPISFMMKSSLTGSTVDASDVNIYMDSNDFVLFPYNTRIGTWYNKSYVNVVGLGDVGSTQNFNDVMSVWELRQGTTNMEVLNEGTSLFEFNEPNANLVTPYPLSFWIDNVDLNIDWLLYRKFTDYEPAFDSSYTLVEEDYASWNPIYTSENFVLTSPTQTTRFRVNSGTLQTDHNDDVWEDLTSNQVAISDLTLTEVSYPTINPRTSSVHVRLTVRHKNPGDLSSFRAVSTLETTVELGS